ELQYVEDRNAAAVRGRAGGKVDAVEGDVGQAGIASRLPCRGDLGRIVVDAAIGEVQPGSAQGVREQADAAAQVEQWRTGAAQRVDDTGIQRIRAQLGARIEVVHAAAMPAFGRKRRRDALRRLPIEGAGIAHAIASSLRATGNASSTQRRYIAAEGCSPSSTSIAGSAPCWRATGAMSTNSTSCIAHTPAATALYASRSCAIRATSRPEPAPNGVTPQSGIASTM